MTDERRTEPTPPGYQHPAPAPGPDATQEVPVGDTGVIPPQWYDGPGHPSQQPQAQHQQQVPQGYPMGTPYGQPLPPGASPAAAGSSTAAGAGRSPLGDGQGGRRGPRWGFVVAAVALASVMSGLLGGLAGGLVAANQGWGSAGHASGAIPTAGPGATSRPEGSVASIAAKALPSVVTIKVAGDQGSGTGSGFVIDGRGHIVTNNHVIDSAVSGGTIKVQLSNGTELPAKIVGRDVSYDLAVLEVARHDLAPLTIGDSTSVVVGDPVIAVGAPLGLESTVTTGIVSAVDRPVTAGENNSASFISAIQTDAAINPGNSGGPLLDMSGHVIGVNSAIAQLPGSTQSASGSIGLGFAIPSDTMKHTVEQLIATGKAEHPVIGVMLDTRYTGPGAKILSAGSNGQQPVTPGGAADKAGIKPGDIITKFEGKPVTSQDVLIVAIRAHRVGDKVSLTVLRGSRTIDMSMVLQASK